MEEIGIGIFLLVLFCVYCYITAITLAFVADKTGHFIMNIDNDKLIYFMIGIGILAAIGAYFYYELSILATIGVGIGSMLAFGIIFGLSFYIVWAIILAIGSGIAVFTINFFESYKYKLEGGYITLFVLAYIFISVMLLFFRDEIT